MAGGYLTGTIDSKRGMGSIIRITPTGWIMSAGPICFAATGLSSTRFLGAGASRLNVGFA